MSDFPMLLNGFLTPLMFPNCQKILEAGFEVSVKDI